MLIAALAAVGTSHAIWPDVAAPSVFRYCGMMGGGDNFVMEGSCTPVGPRHVLTAAHLGSTRVKIGGVVYMPVQKINHPSADLSIVEVNGTLPNWYQVHLTPYTNLERKQTALVGHGFTGTPRPDGSGYIINNTSNSVLRSGMNVLGSRDQFEVNGRTSWSMLWDVDKEGYVDRLGDGLAIPGECQVAVGDSGGSMFVMHEGVWQLVGVITFTFRDPTNISSNTYGAGGGGTELYAYRDWINATLPPKINSTGTATLQNLNTSPSNHTIRVEIRAPGGSTPLEVHRLNLNATGGYTLPTYRVGEFDILVKASHWLTSKFTSVWLGAEGTTGLNISLRNGDVDGNDAVNIADFLLLRNAFGSSTGGPGWNPNADLNGDGSVNAADFLILRANFGQTGG